jgi:hypothetical protein
MALQPAKCDLEILLQVEQRRQLTTGKMRQASINGESQPFAQVASAELMQRSAVPGWQLA